MYYSYIVGFKQLPDRVGPIKTSFGELAERCCKFCKEQLEIYKQIIIELTICYHFNHLASHFSVLIPIMPRPAHRTHTPRSISHGRPYWTHQPSLGDRTHRT